MKDMLKMVYGNFFSEEDMPEYRREIQQETDPERISYRVWNHSRLAKFKKGDAIVKGIGGAVLLAAAPITHMMANMENVDSFTKLIGYSMFAGLGLLYSSFSIASMRQTKELREREDIARSRLEQLTDVEEQV